MGNIWTFNTMCQQKRFIKIMDFEYFFREAWDGWWLVSPSWTPGMLSRRWSFLLTHCVKKTDFLSLELIHQEFQKCSLFEKRILMNQKAKAHLSKYDQSTRNNFAKQLDNALLTFRIFLANAIIFRKDKIINFVYIFFSLEK